MIFVLKGMNQIKVIFGSSQDSKHKMVSENIMFYPALTKKVLWNETNRIIVIIRIGISIEKRYLKMI